MARKTFFRPPIVHAPIGHGDDLHVVPARVGLQPWLSPRAAWTFVVKVARPLAAGPEGGAFTDPAPLHARAREPLPTDVTPDDFLPAKDGVDVVLVGHAWVIDPAGDGTFARDAELRVGDRVFPLRLASRSQGRVPLAPPALVADGRLPAGPEPPRVGPRATPPADAFGDLLPQGSDGERFRCAPEHLRFDGLPPGTRVAVSGLGEDGAARAFVVPAESPFVWLDPARASAFESELLLRLDTVTIDVDRGVADLVYRGHAYAPDRPRDIDRVVVAWLPESALDLSREERWEAPLRELPRGRFELPTLREEARAGAAAPPLEPDALDEMRYGTLDENAAPSTRLSADHYARVALALAEGRAPRADVLAAEGLDEYDWTVEERAWATRLAEPPPAAELQGEETGSARAEAAAATARAAAQAGPPAIGAEAYGRAAVRMELEDPRRVLADLGLGIGAWARAESHWQTAAASDPAVAAAIDRAAAEERARARPDRPDGMPDWEGIPK